MSFLTEIIQKIKSFYTPNYVIKKGDEGGEVKDIQRKLSELGYTITIDGDFGNSTEKIVKAFQKDRDLKDDGVVGVLTQNELYKEIEDAPIDSNPADDNVDPEKPDDGGDYTAYPEDEEELYYPKAIRSGKKLRTRNYYKDSYPQGMLTHFTAGRSRNKKDGGSRNADTHLEMGKRDIAYAESKGSYCYFVMDRSGNVHQNFPLNRWGYHGGKSAWVGLSGSVSDELVGVEIQNAGRLQSYYQNSENGTKRDCPTGKLAAWFTRPNSGDLFFDKEKECRYSGDNDNIQKGWYHAFSPEQEEELLELYIWLKRNNPDIFKFKFSLGHDEVAGKKGIGYNRKNDPGASLSMTMTEFRSKIEKEYARRYPEG